MSIKRTLVLAGIAGAGATAIGVGQAYGRLAYAEADWDQRRYALAAGIRDRHDVAWKITEACRYLPGLSGLAKVAEAANGVAMDSQDEDLPRSLQPERDLSKALKALLAAAAGVAGAPSELASLDRQLKESGYTITMAIAYFNQAVEAYNEVLGGPWLAPIFRWHASLEMPLKERCEDWIKPNRR